MLPAGIGQGEVIEAVFERLPGDADGEIAHVGEVRQALPTRRMVLAEDHLPLRPVQAMPGADPPLQRAAQPVPIAVRMAPLHLLEQGDRPQAGPALQQAAGCRSPRSRPADPAT